MNPARLAVTVVWATPEVQDVVALELPAGAVVADAIAASGLLICHGVDPRTVRWAIDGRLVADDAPLAAGDRVEICRALTVDPKEARRLRAAAKGHRGGR